VICGLGPRKLAGTCDASRVSSLPRPGRLPTRLHMDDIPSLRAELKAWEREFKTDHGREPSVDDIKERPSIGASHSGFTATL
jgi:hypothetical protein